MTEPETLHYLRRIDNTLDRIRADGDWLQQSQFLIGARRWKCSR